MADDLVVDASVVAKLYFIEESSDLAEVALRGAKLLIAPELLLVEVASIAVKRLRRGTSTLAQAASAAESVASLLDETVPVRNLAPRAFALAAAHGFSVYDGTYLALAEARGLQVITADFKLVRLARQAGLSALIRPLE